MRLLVIVTGLGYGDSTRVDAVLKEIEKRKPVKILVMAYDNSYEYLKDKYETIRIKGYKFEQKGLKFRTGSFLFKNFDIPLSWILNYRENKDKLREFNPDLIISDFEIFSNFLARRLSKKCISIFAFDPELYKEYPYKKNNLNIQAKFLSKTYEISNRVIIPSFIKNKKEGNIHFVNPIIRESENKDRNYLMKKIGLKNEPILIMLGGSNYGLELKERINDLKKKFKEDFIFFGGKAKFKGDFLDYLRICKGLITLAGNLTLSEGLFYKKQMLVYPIENHVEQLLNAYSIKEYIMIGNRNNVEGDLNQFIAKLNKPFKRPCLKFDGAKQAAKIILDNYN